MSMYNEVREQQKKLKGKSFREKAEYFWYYYKLHVLVVIVVIVTVGILVKDMASSRPEAFSAVLLNAMGSESQEAFQADFAAYAEIDTNTYSCTIDTAATFSMNSMSQFDFITSQKIIGLAQAGNMDVIVSDTQTFFNYAEGKMFLDLSQVLTAEEYSKYQEYFYYIDYKDENGTVIQKDVPVGIYVTDSAKLKEWNCYTDAQAQPVFGFVYSSQREGLCHLFLEYLMEE